MRRWGENVGEKKGKRGRISRKRVMRLIIGTMVLTSVVLTQWVSPWWLLLTTFIGLNLFQSGLTGWCLLEDILGWLDIGEA